MSKPRLKALGRGTTPTPARPDRPGLKRIECRTWKTSFRGRILIHAARRYSTEHADLAGVDPRLMARLLKPRGIVLGELDLVDCREALPDDEPAALCPGRPAHYAWVFASDRECSSPWPAAGRLGLFEI